MKNRFELTFSGFKHFVIGFKYFKIFLSCQVKDCMFYFSELFWNKIWRIMMKNFIIRLCMVFELATFKIW